MYVVFLLFTQEALTVVYVLILSPPPPLKKQLH